MRKLKCIRNINDIAVQGRLSENYLTQKIIARNILDTKYSRFTVHNCTTVAQKGHVHYPIQYFLLPCNFDFSHYQLPIWLFLISDFEFSHY